MKRNCCLLIFVLTTVYYNANSQSQIDFGYSFGANATISRTIETDNNTWGYSTPPYPNTWNNHFYIGYGSQKSRAYLTFTSGSLAVNYKVKNRPNKYPLGTVPDADSVYFNGDSVLFSSGLSINRSSMRGIHLIHLGLLYKHQFHSSKNFEHKGIIGAGFLKTYAMYNGNISLGSNSNTPFPPGTVYNSDDGWLSNTFSVNHYGFLRELNIYLTTGYECSYKLNNHWSINASVMYNQGIYKMLHWHTSRSYTESVSGYSEYDEQWSFTRLSYFAFLTGVSYTLDLKKKD